MGEVVPARTLADPTSPIPSYCASIVMTSTLRVRMCSLCVQVCRIYSIRRYIEMDSFSMMKPSMTQLYKKRLKSTGSHSAVSSCLTRSKSRTRHVLFYQIPGRSSTTSGPNSRLNTSPCGRSGTTLARRVALYFAWSGCIISTLWIPMLLGLAIFFYGLQLRYVALSVWERELACIQQLLIFLVWERERWAVVIFCWYITPTSVFFVINSYSASHGNWCTTNTLKQYNDSTVRGDGGSRVGEVRAGTTSPMPEHKGFKLQ